MEHYVLGANSLTAHHRGNPHFQYVSDITIPPTINRCTKLVSYLFQAIIIHLYLHNCRIHELAYTIPDILNLLTQNHRSQFLCLNNHWECKHISALVFTAVLNFYEIIILINSLYILKLPISGLPIPALTSNSMYPSILFSEPFNPVQAVS